VGIAKTAKDSFEKVMQEHFTPSKEILTPSRLYGRENALKQIERALNSQGRHVFIYGDRGVGKTSLARTAAFIHNSSDEAPIYVACGSSGYADVIQAIGNSAFDIKERFDPTRTGRQYSASIMGVGGGYNPGSLNTTSFSKPSSLNESMDIIKYVCSKRKGRTIIVIDEMERLPSAKDRDNFAEFIKNINTIDEDVRFIFGGIASDIDELLNHHESAGRLLEPIELKRLNHDELWMIITSAADLLKISVDREMLIRIGKISDGFPHYVHLIGAQLFWAAFDDKDDVHEIKKKHYTSAIKRALDQTEHILKKCYQKATQKSANNTINYEEALWAISDSTADRRQVTEIYESSYVPIMHKRASRITLKREQFNQKLIALCKDTHGKILVSHKAGWFSFRESIMRGYVRLKAEEQQVILKSLARIS
jgi:uncharacterized protein